VNTVGLAEVAAEIVTLETCAPADACLPALSDSDRNPFIGWSTEPATLRMARLRDVVLDRSLMVLLKDGSVIAETNYLQAPAAIAAARVRTDALTVVDAGCAVSACFDHWPGNYYHWVAHTLPTVQAVLERHADGDCSLLLPRMAPWQRRSLALIGASSLPTIATEPEAQYFLPEVEYYDFVAGRADYAVSALSRAAYARMAAGCEADGEADGAAHRLIYIDRGGSANRRLPNEAALVARLRTRGFHIVRPETLELDGQIALFRQAGMVVGQLGAGLANIAFCQKGTVIYELVPEHHRNPCFVAMASQGGLLHWGDVFPTGVRGEDHTSPWTRDIDIDLVLRRIDELSALVPPERAPSADGFGR
jgi:capsular polysaccharide biosynthesis protein